MASNGAPKIDLGPMIIHPAGFQNPLWCICARLDNQNGVKKVSKDVHMTFKCTQNASLRKHSKGQGLKGEPTAINGITITPYSVWCDSDPSNSHPTFLNVFGKDPNQQDSYLASTSRCLHCQLHQLKFERANCCPIRPSNCHGLPKHTTE